MTTLHPSSAETSATDTAHDHEDHRMFGVATFLVADAMTFAGFFAAYLTFHAVNPLEPGAVYELELPLPILNTVLLLVSSATFHKAGQKLRQRDNSGCRQWLLITAALGLAFLASQMVEYFTLPFGLTDNLFASTFYALTGISRSARDLGCLDDSDRVVAVPHTQDGSRPTINSPWRPLSSTGTSWMASGWCCF